MKHGSSSAGIPISVDPSWRIGIIHSSFYREETGAMVESARQALLTAGIRKENILEYPVPGSFEIPLIGSVLSHEKKADALIGIGIIVEGETHHAELLARTTAQGIMDIQVKEGMPFAFEVLFVSDLAQARARGDKGGEAARAVLHSLALIAKQR